MSIDLQMDANSKIFENKQQQNDNIIITSNIRSTDNTYEDKQVCIYH